MLVHLVEYGRDDPMIVGVFWSLADALDAVTELEPDGRRRYKGSYAVIALEIGKPTGIQGWTTWGPESYSDRQSPIVEKRSGVYAGIQEGP